MKEGERDRKAGATEKSAFYHIIQLVWLWSGATTAAAKAASQAASWIGAAHTLMLRHSTHQGENKPTQLKEVNFI